MNNNDNVKMTNPNARKFYDGDYIGQILLDEKHENVLTNIKVEEEHRGNSYSRVMINKWLKSCFSNGYEEAYVVNIKSPAIKHVVKTLRRYDSQKVCISQAPGNIKSGVGVSDLTFKITRRS